MTIMRIAGAALLIAALGLAGCGLKGDPIRPGSEKGLKRQHEQQQKQQSNE